MKDTSNEIKAGLGLQEHIDFLSMILAGYLRQLKDIFSMLGNRMYGEKSTGKTSQKPDLIVGD